MIADRCEAKQDHGAFRLRARNADFPEERTTFIFSIRSGSAGPGSDNVVSFTVSNSPTNRGRMFCVLTDWPYQEMNRLDPQKPIMVTEWATGEFPIPATRRNGFGKRSKSCERNCRGLRAEVYWHERWQNADQSYSNLHINSSPEALAAYRKAVADKYWLGDLILRPAPISK